MRCYICDRVLNEPVWNSEIEGHEPCPTCLEIIEDAVGDFRDKAAASEDDLPEWDVLAWLASQIEPPDEDDPVFEDVHEELLADD